MPEDLAEPVPPGPPRLPGSLLRTKLLIPPPRSNRVVREALVARIAEGAQLALTLISAPAGFGKTSLLVEWAAANPMPVAWVSLDGEDNDPHRFLSYLAGSLERALPGINFEARLWLQSPQPSPPQAILSALINDVSQFSQPFALVLDDYQAITNPEVNRAVAFLLERQPPQMHLLIATRADPPLPLARLRASGQLAELRMRDLRFTRQEAAGFLNQVMGSELSYTDVATLEERTEGWAAGLQIAALSLQGRPDKSQFVQTFSGSSRYILEYLFEEVLDRQPPGVQDFLLRTSILERLTGALCAAVTVEPGGQPISGQEMLARLDRSNLFLISLDDEGCWYRYHPLFADLLRTRLRQEFPALESRLHLSASAWFEKEGWEVEAINHALAAHDYQRAAWLVEQNANALLTRGELSTLLNRIQSLPAEWLQKSPALSIILAETLIFSGRLEGVEPHLQDAERALAQVENPAVVQEIRGSVAIIRALVADIRGDWPAAVDLAQQASGLLPAGALLTRSLVPFVLGDGHLILGDMEKAGAAFAEILEIGRTADNLWTMAVAYGKLANHAKMQGRLRQAEAYYQQAIQMAGERGGRRFGTLAALYTGFADLLRERDDLPAARETVTGALDSMGQWVSPTDEVNARLVLARVLQAQGELDSADAELQKAASASGRSGVFLMTQRMLDACQVRLWLAQGRLDQAAGWLEASLGRSAITAPSGMAHELERITTTRVLLALDRTGEALELLAALSETTRIGDRAGRFIEVSILRAAALEALKQTAPALEVLAGALTLAMPEDYRRIFLDEGEPVRSLLSALAEQQAYAHLAGYARRLLAAFPVAHPPVGITAALSLVEGLTARELEVLRLICQGLTNNEISQRLVITLNTVKRHNNSLFSKLGVSNRAQAIVHARELGLDQPIP